MQQCICYEGLPNQKVTWREFQTSLPAICIDCTGIKKSNENANDKGADEEK
jgi:hypothetical protein